MARPIPRWTLYVAKLLIAAVMVAAGTLFLLAGIFVSGAILPYLQPQLTFKTNPPWAMLFRDGSYIVGLEFLALAAQHWVSLRWRSFPVAIATGMVALVLAFMAVTAGRQAGWPEYFPWALPMLVVAPQPHNLALVLRISAPAGLLAVAAGCFDFCRREVS